MNLYILRIIFLIFCSGISDCVAFTWSVFLTANSTKQTIRSPNYPDVYGSSMEVTWVIVADSSINNAVIQIQVLDSYIEPSTACYNDEAYIINGPKSYNPYLDSWCGNSYTKTTQTSNSDTIQVVFRSNAYRNNYKGFMLEYWAISKPIALTGTVKLHWLHYSLLGVFGGIVLAIIIALIFLVIARKKIAAEKSVPW